MFLDVPECSGMFRNVPCSIFYRRPYLFKVSYVLFQNCSVVLFMIFLSFPNCTALPCSFFVISFRFCWVEFPRRYRSCLLVYGNMSRLAFCLVRTELKLRRFRKPAFMLLKSGACCKYLTSIHEYLVSSHKPVFVGLNYWCMLLLKLKELFYSQKYSHWIRVLLYCCLLLAASMGTTIEQLPVKARLSQQFWQSQGCFTYGRVTLEYDAFDVLLKCVSLAHIKRLCWTLQVVEWGDVLVYTNDVLQCLHPSTYKATYVQKCRVMRFMLYMMSITIYSLY